MLKNLSLFFVILFVGSPGLCATKELSLREALRLMLKNDFDVKIAESAIEEKKALIDKSLGDFDFHLSANTKVEHSETPSASSLDGVTSAVISDTKAISPTLSKKTALGTELSLPYSFTISESNSSYSRIPKGYNTSLALKVIQPLVRGFRPSYFLRNIEKSATDLKVAQEKFGDQIGENLKKTIGLYLDALRNQRIVEIRTQSRVDGSKTLEAAKAKQAVGKSSLIDVLDAESTLQKAIEAQLTASNDYRAGLEQLALKVYGDGTREVTLKENIQDWLKPPEKMPFLDLLEEAKKVNPDLQTSLLTMKQAQNELENASVDQLPDIKLDGSMTFKGLADDFSKSQEQINKGQHKSYSVALKWEQPLMRYAAKGERRVKEVKVKQEQIKRLQSERNVALSIRKALRDMETNWARLEALSRVSAIEQEKYTGQQRRFEQGKISVFELNESLLAKETAALELAKAQIAYVKARYDLYNSVGTLTKELNL